MSGAVRHTGEYASRRSTLVLEELPSIDIRELKRIGFLDTASRATVDWKIQNQALGKVIIACSDQRISITYTCASATGTRGSQQQSIAVDHTHPHLGGARPWFVCPECGQRCAIIYFDGMFKCRRCTRRHYYCQRVDERHRLLARMIKIRQQLEGTTLMGEFFPQRPKGMHMSRYRALVKRHAAFEVKLGEVEKQRNNAGCHQVYNGTSR